MRSIGADAADHVRTSSPSTRPLITTGSASTAAAAAANASATESSPAPSRIDPQAHRHHRVAAVTPLDETGARGAEPGAETTQGIGEIRIDGADEADR